MPGAGRGAIAGRLNVLTALRAVVFNLSSGTGMNRFSCYRGTIFENVPVFRARQMPDCRQKFFWVPQKQGNLFGHTPLGCELNLNSSPKKFFHNRSRRDLAKRNTVFKSIDLR